jgi:hypothetical protein
MARRDVARDDRPMRVETTTDRSRICDLVLFTDRANPTSNRIYQALGYRAVEDRAVVIVG